MSLDGMRNVFTKSSSYWENEFSSGKFTAEQINELKKIPVNQYSKIVASEVDRNYDDIIFEIPDRKNLRNKFLGRPDMIEAIDAFYDISAVEIYDEDNSSVDEDRYKLIAMSKSNKILDVIYFERDVNTIRIISVFKATKEEERIYESNKIR